MNAFDSLEKIRRSGINQRAIDLAYFSLLCCAKEGHMPRYLVGKLASKNGLPLDTVLLFFWDDTGGQFLSCFENGSLVVFGDDGTVLINGCETNAMETVRLMKTLSLIKKGAQ